MFTSWSFPCNIYAKAGSFFTRVDSSISILPVVHANPFQTSVFRGFPYLKKIFINVNVWVVQAEEVVKNEPADNYCPARIVPGVEVLFLFKFISQGFTTDSQYLCRQGFIIIHTGQDILNMF